MGGTTILQQCDIVPQVNDASQFLHNRAKLDGLVSYCQECGRSARDDFRRKRLAAPKSVVPPFKRCATCGEVCFRLPDVSLSLQHITCQMMPRIRQYLRHVGVAMACRTSPLQATLQMHMQ